jgi:hypothetical protein
MSKPVVEFLEHNAYYHAEGGIAFSSETKMFEVFCLKEKCMAWQKEYTTAKIDHLMAPPQRVVKAHCRLIGPEKE